MSEQLYEKYRPKKFEDIIGYKSGEIAKIIKQKLDAGNLPQVMLFSGPTGTGKTTLARIIAGHLVTSDMDLQEINMSDKTGIDDIRNIAENLNLAPFGKSKVFILDEIHNVSKQGQDALLKHAEDVPPHTYFILCTDSPEKLDKALSGRCVLDYKLERPEDTSIAKMLINISNQEGIKLSAEDAFQIASSSQDCRRAINNLEKLTSDSKEITKDILNRFLSLPEEESNESFKLVSNLIWPKYSTPLEGWENVSDILAKEIEKSTAQEIALRIAGYCRNSLLQKRYLYWGNNKDKKKDAETARKEFTRLNRVLRIFSRDLFMVKPENMLVSLYVEAVLETLRPIN